MYSPKKVQDATPEHINASLANVAQAINGLSSQRVVDSSSIYIVKNNGYRIQDASSPPIYVFQMTATAQNLLLPDCSRNIGRTIEVDTVLVGSAPSSYGAVTIKAAGNDTIVGLSSYSITVPWMSATFFSVGTAWIVKVQALSVAPVSGEQSLGTLHMLARVPTGWDQSSLSGGPTVFTCAHVPVGAKAVVLTVVMTMGAAGVSYAYFRRTGTSAHADFDSIVVGGATSVVTQYASIVVPLNTAGQFTYQVSTSGTLFFTEMGYYI